MNITQRLVLLFLAISLVPLCIVGYFGYHNGITTIKQDTVDRLVSTNELKAAEVNRWINANQSQLKALAQRPLVRIYAATLANPRSTTQEIQMARHNLLTDHFKPSISYGAGFLDLSLIHHQDGRIMATTEELLKGKYRDGRRFFLEGLNKTFVDDMTYELGMERLVMHISTPVKGSDGLTVAVLAGHMDWHEMSQIMAQGRDRSNSEESYLVNKSNYFVTESRFGRDYPLKKTIHTVGVDRCLEGKEGVELYDDYRGQHVIGAFNYMPEWNLCILTEEDQSEAFAPAVTFRNLFLIVGLAASLSAAVLSWLFARTIARRVRVLVVGAEEIGKGNLDHRIDARGEDEISQLARSFNDMASARKASEDLILKSRDELEDRVNERTLEISSANKLLVKEIVERKQIEGALRDSEAKLLSSLTEKEVLLREIHHRVKNNLQMIQSLISLQTQKLAHKELRQALKDSNSRIKSMSLIHETLYRSDNLANLDLDKYFRQLVRHLVKLYGRSQENIEITFHIDPLMLDMDSSIACGLVVNELVTNALKYAFDNGSPGVIAIHLRRMNDRQAELMVRDNGKGFSDQEAALSQNTLGLKIVHMLAVDQLQGQMTIDGKSGVHFKIQFPIQIELRGQS